MAFARRFLVLISLLALPLTAAEALDPHAIYETRCAGCHLPHAGDFARESLVQGEGGIVGRKSGKELASFLRGGHGRLQKQEIDVLVTQFAAILETGGVFAEKCRACHRSARGLARNKLILRSGRLFGRYSGRDMAVFLANHGRLEGEEVETVLNMLRRHLAGDPTRQID